MIDAIDAYLCECNDIACRGRIRLKLGEMLDIRAAHPPADGFAIVVPGHELGEPIVCVGVAISGDPYIIVRGRP